MGAVVLEPQKKAGRFTKIRSVFQRLETAMRTELSEERVALELDALDIDHVMPQSWHAHWRLPHGNAVSAVEAVAAVIGRFSPDGIDERTSAILMHWDAILRMGNLTLVHYGVNRSLQNAAFESKRNALFEHSNLHLNRQLMQREAWDEAGIAARGEELAELPTKIWPRPM
ncbi:HNH endonuclease family protein [Methyloversatilis discipulorum]|uniref:HNH endonuclease family protein n=1 Tax=Methyloversatilis discipulorum TaxID=1119528 RepID=UPI003F2EEE2B